jgi:perosamine synthetase
VVKNYEIRIPVYDVSLTEAERKALISTYDSGWLSGTGPAVQIAEQKLSEYLNTETYVLANGTVALHLALLGLDVKPGDSILVPSFSYVAPSNAIRYCGAMPRFVDCDRSSWCATVQTLNKSLDDTVKGVLVVHNYGALGEIKQIAHWAKENGLWLLEDCAEAFGSKTSSQMAGTFGDISTFSFFGNKTITTGEGGALSINNARYIDRIKLLKSQGLTGNKPFWHETIGYNYRLNSLSASLIPSQLSRIDQIIGQKKLIFDKYKQNLSGAFEFQYFDIDECPWLVSILLGSHALRGELAKRLLSVGIETRPTFYPAHTLPAHIDNRIKLDVCEDVALRGLSLPSSPNLSTKVIRQICEEIYKWGEDIRL